MSRGLLGKNSPLHIRQRRRDALKEADLVVLAGTAIHCKKIDFCEKISAYNNTHKCSQKYYKVLNPQNQGLAAWSVIKLEQLELEQGPIQ